MTVPSGFRRVVDGYQMLYLSFNIGTSGHSNTWVFAVVVWKVYQTVLHATGHLYLCPTLFQFNLNFQQLQHYAIQLAAHWRKPVPHAFFIRGILYIQIHQSQSQINHGFLKTVLSCPSNSKPIPALLQMILPSHIGLRRQKSLDPNLPQFSPFAPQTQQLPTPFLPLCICSLSFQNVSIISLFLLISSSLLSTNMLIP